MGVARVADDFLRDLRYAARLMARAPGFTVAAVLSLALGVGAATAIFSLFDALLLKPLPVDAPGELRVTALHTWAGARVAKSSTLHPYAWFRDLGASREVFSEVLAFFEMPDLEIAHEARQLHTRGGTVFVSDNFFTALGIAAARGRSFTPHTAADSRMTAVVADGFWRRELGGGSDVIGRVLHINNVPFTIIGVAPPGFFGLRIGHVPDVFLPLDSISAVHPGRSRLQDDRNWRVQVVGRRKAAISDAVASDQLTAQWNRVFPPRPGDPKVSVAVAPLETGLSTVRERFAQPLWVLLVMVGLLLFIGCANAATMLVSRASARRIEMAIRASIGAGRPRLLRQLAAESLLLTGVAAVAGVAVALWMIDGLPFLLPEGDQRVLLDLRLDRRVLLFTIAVCAGAAILSTVAPAIHASHPSGRGITTGRLTRPFVVGQLALALVLLLGAGLLTRTLLELTRVNPGFEAERIVLADVEPARREYTPPQLDRYYHAMLERLRDVPGVTAVSFAQVGFLGSGRTTGTVDVPGFVPRSDAERWVQVFFVGPDFFQTLGMTLVAGRDFTDMDVDFGAGVAALNEIAARRYFGLESPIGRMVISDGAHRVVAVVRNARYNSLRDDNVAALFVPYKPSHIRCCPRGRMVFAARTELTDAAAIEALGAAVRAVDPLVPRRISTLAAVKEQSMSQERLLAAVSTWFAITALVLVAVGLYGVMAFWVVERTREIGIRVALGAAPARVLRVVLARVLALVAAGTGLGLVAAAIGSRLIASLLFGLAPHDPLTVAGATLVLAAVAMVAGYVPARRASRVDPVIALRCE